MAKERAPKRIGVDQDASFNERKLMVLRTAARLISENGFTQTSIDDIARDMGVTKPTIYHYVGSKDGIILECLQTGSAGLAAFVEAIDKSGKNGKEKIAALMQTHAQSVGDDFGRCLITVDHKALKPASQEEMARYSDRYLEIVEQFVREGIKDGSIKKRDPELVTKAIIGAFNFVAQWYQPGGPVTTDEISKTFLSLFEDGL